jgi:quinol monooxygenase YgiN
VLLDLVEPTRAEPGCLHYELLQNVSDPTDFTFVQEWESKEAFEAHLNTDHTKQVARKLTQLLKVMPDIRRYTPIE